ncbi:CTR2 [Candida margitis]|uniref:CTR2 n=1 Tax=Candida margitis TaxID=1775924 RepID=UPI0022268596|nr:CTR2 [Candida margitis]KAI5954126.1 CTR2 [Candida margitis]
MIHSQTTMNHDMPMPSHPMPDDMCSMNMLFTWDWNNSCVVFKWWHVKSFSGFLISMVVIVLISAGYELVKGWVANWERNSLATLTASTSNTNSTQQRKFKTQRGVLYGFQVFYSFFLMLVFMTYNGWYMIAVAVGAGLGNYFWAGLESTSRTLSCH